MLTKVLKIIRKMFFYVGIDIKLVKKEESISAIEHNSVDARNSFYKDSKKIKKYLAEKRLDFYEKTVQIIKANEISLDAKDVADVGCGTGKLFVFIDKIFNVDKFIGFDFSPEAINLSKTVFPKGEFYVYDIYQKNEHKFDFIFCTEVLEHLLHPEIALSNLLAMLKDNSHLLITVPNGRIDNFNGHIQFWSPESWEVFIEKNINDNKAIFGKINSNLFALISN